MRPLLAVLLGVGLAACSSGPRELTDQHRQAVEATLKARGLDQPSQLALESNGFIVADYVIRDVDAGHAQAIGEERLLAIRDALLPFGFEDYRVNVNGPSPGSGLVRRYGAARFIGGGSLEWKAP